MPGSSRSIGKWQAAQTNVQCVYTLWCIILWLRSVPRITKLARVCRVSLIPLQKHLRTELISLVSHCDTQRLNCSREEASIICQDDITTLTDILARLHIHHIFHLHRPERTSCRRSYCIFWLLTTNKIRSNENGGGMVYNPSMHVMSIQTLKSLLWSRWTILLLRHVCKRYGGLNKPS